MPKSSDSETRDGVQLTHLDAPLFDDAGVTKRQLVDYLDQVSDRILPELADRALSVIRARPGQQPFMQKNLPRTAPSWISRIDLWSAASQRTVHYPVCADRPTLLWLANQRAVEYHPALVDSAGRQSELIIDLDPPEGADFGAVAAVALSVRQVLTDCGLEAWVKTSGSKGVHVLVPLTGQDAIDDIAAATRALATRTAALDPERATDAYLKADRGGRVYVDPTRAGGATVAAAYSPRARPGLPVSFPVTWSELAEIQPADFTVTTALDRLDGSAEPPPRPSAQALPADLIEEGHRIPVARVAAMHEGKRRKRARGD